MEKRLNSIDFGQIKSKRDWKLIKIKMDDKILTLKSESLYNRCPKLLKSNFESSMIRFGDTNRLSLPCTSRVGVNVEKVIEISGGRLVKGRV